MIRTQAILRLIVSLIALGCSSTSQEPISATSLSDELEQVAANDDTPVTEANVHAMERYWPSIVSMAANWTPPGATSVVQKGYRGALLRVERDGGARIDFGRHGSHAIPLRYTHLVDEANEVRTGTRHKVAPNFVLHVATHLAVDAGDTLRPLRHAEIAETPAFLCVFVDPRVEGFPALIDQLAALEGVGGMRTLYFPQSVDRKDMQVVRDAMQRSQWHVPFMYPRLSESYTESLLGEPPVDPYVLLVTPEGRALYRASLDHAGVVAALRGALAG